MNRSTTPVPELPEPGLHLLRQVRAYFVLHGRTMKSWCRENGVYPSNAREALVGTWNGPAGRKVRERLCREAGLLIEPPAEERARRPKAVA